MGRKSFATTVCPDEMTHLVKHCYILSWEFVYVKHLLRNMCRHKYTKYQNFYADTHLFIIYFLN